MILKIAILPIIIAPNEVGASARFQSWFCRRAGTRGFILCDSKIALVKLLENGALHKASWDAGLACIALAKPMVRRGLGLEEMTQ